MRCMDCKFIVKHLADWITPLAPVIFWCGHSKVERQLARDEVENEAPCDCPESRPVEY